MSFLLQRASPPSDRPDLILSAWQAAQAVASRRAALPPPQREAGR